jgi:adenylate cyclase
MEINYAEGFPVVSAIDVLDGRAPPNLFAGKDVLVGVTALGLGDQKLTPLDKANGQPGVIVLANAYNTMKRGAYLTPASNGETFAFVVALAFLVLAAVAFLPLWLSALATALLFATYFAVAFRTFDSGTVLNLVYPPLAMVVGFVAGLGLRYFGEMRERRHVTRVFGRYAAPHVVREILAKPEDAVRSLQGETRELSVLFADLRGFTAASEQLAPADVVAALNVYLEAMTTAIQDEDGTIDKFVGDEVMAFWGAPLEQPDYALRAARAALRILELIEDVMMRPPAIDLKVKGAGVGIATGPCLVGNVGSMRRLDYTAIGDTVNTAARLCSSAEPGVIIVTEACAQRLRGSLALGDLPDLIAKGKREPIRIAQVLRPGR